MNNNQTLTLLKIAKKLAPKYCFGYYEVDDIVQEAFIIGMKALSSYKEELGSLSTFLFIHINNRLKSFKRDHYYRIPKYHCDNVDGNCKKCFEQQNKINRKKSLVSPVDIDGVDGLIDENSYELLSSLEFDEIMSLIDEGLPIELRIDYLKMKDGISIPKTRRLEIELALQKIVESYNA